MAEAENETKMQAWNADHYDAQIGYVSRLGKSLMALLSPNSGERVLDLGCGTGDLSHEIEGYGAVCVGVDASGAMIERAQAKYPGMTFRTADGQTFRLEAGEQPFDAVFSNAALHWMLRAESAAEAVWLALRPGGRFVAEFGGHGNVQKIKAAIEEAIDEAGIRVPGRSPWYFPTVGTYASLLEKQGFEVRFAELYDRPTRLDGGSGGLRHWLDAFAGAYFGDLTPSDRERAYERCEQRLREECFDGEAWTADYRRIRIHAVKHGG